MEGSPGKDNGSGEAGDSPIENCGLNPGIPGEFSTKISRSSGMAELLFFPRRFVTEASLVSNELRTAHKNSLAINPWLPLG
jgi:hypothetical protein